MARKKRATPKPQSEAANEIGDALRARAISPRSRPVRDTNINIRVTSELKQEITQLAEQLGVSVTDYITELHKQARAILVDREVP